MLLQFFHFLIHRKNILFPVSNEFLRLKRSDGLFCCGRTGFPRRNRFAESRLPAAPSLPNIRIFASEKRRSDIFPMQSARQFAKPCGNWKAKAVYFSTCETFLYELSSPFTGNPCTFECCGGVSKIRFSGRQSYPLLLMW